MPHMIALLDVFLIGAAAYFVKRLLDSRRYAPLPPGPTGWPVIGNIFQVPPEKNWEYFTELGKKYGDVSSISVLGSRYVILNSAKAVMGILEKQSIKCSDRPRLTMATDLVGFKGMLFVNYNDRFRQYRKLFSRLFGSRSSIAVFNSVQEEGTRQLLCSVLRQPNDLAMHIRSNARTTILKMTYGYDIQEGKDPFVELADKVLHVFPLLANPGAYLVNVIPALKYLPRWVPGTGFLQEAKRYREYVFDLAQKPHQYVLEQMAAGKAVSSFSSTLLEGDVTSEEEDIVMWASMQVYLGALDTVVSTVHGFFLAMVLYPEVQAKAQVEIDSVIGSDRLPSFTDRDSLPYINAICKEVFRWHTVAMPHMATKDIYYEEFLLPKGTFIIGNSWAILKDECRYPDPGTFCPERFLGEDPQPDPRNVCFGFGRRACPGSHFAEATLFISVAMSLAVLKISKAVIDGVQVTPEYDVTPGAVPQPKPFKCKISARCAQAEALLRT